MLLRVKILVPLLVLAFAFTPAVPVADAATPSRVTLNVVGSGSSAYFIVNGRVSWVWPTDFVSATWELEYEFHGMDTGHSDIVASWTVPFTQDFTLLQSMPARSFDNRTRWANEDGDRLFRKKRDEIRVIVYVLRNGERAGPGDISNQVVGNF